MADYPPGAPPNGGYQDHALGNAPKRHREDEYGANKRPAYGGGGGPETVFRFLCDYKIVGGMIGKGGANLKEVQQNTGAFIEVIHEAPPHCTERVFVIASPRDAPGSAEYNAAQIALFRCVHVFWPRWCTARMQQHFLLTTSHGRAKA